MTEFTPLPALAGGAMIGLAAVLLMAAIGRVAGISGILGRLLPPGSAAEAGWRISFLLGLLAAPFLVALVMGPFEISISSNPMLLAIAGLLVGFGTGVSGGCTSGHGVCGLSRLSKRSIAATLTFMATGATTVFVARHVIGG